MKQISLFAACALFPLGALAAGFAGFAPGLVLALIYMTLFLALADQLLPRIADTAPEGAEFPAADGVLVVIGFAALLILPYGVRTLVNGGFSTIPRLSGGLALGLWMGQIAIPAAHELIHRGRFRFVRLGVAIYVVLLFGHHASAHRLVHHRLVATPDDPNTARAGESFYRFFRRAWWGSFRAGLAAENRLRREGRHLRGWSGLVHPYLVYLGGGALALGLAFALAGLSGVLVWAALALHAQAQLLLSDYVQHYGLSRDRRPDGTWLPQTAAHSWNAAAWLSGRMMLHAPRHSDHHLNPARPFPALRLPPVTEAPRLPWSLPTACTLALIPPLWRKAIAPHLDRAQSLGNPAPVAKP
jgi:alkane 1-monooxygenase